ncbi:MAG: hypothetical protein KDD89_02065 [Anaerolineales bacterium]|nr:hypothetical protein [Anaerolineales bacterium]
MLKITSVWSWLTAVSLLFVLSACADADPTPTATAVPPAPALLTPNPTAETAYPPPSNPTTPAATSYPAPPTATPIPPATPPPSGYPAYPGGESGSAALFLPLVGVPSDVVAATDVATITPTPLPTDTPSPTPTPIPTIDFTAVQADLRAQGQELGYSKLGFHIGVGGNREGLDEFMRRHNEAGLPFFLKSVGDAGPLFEAQQAMAENGLPHTLVFRQAGNEFDTPNYDLPPAEAAQRHWETHLAVWPPELDPAVVWMETINEVDKVRSEWLAQFALETAKLALRDGRKWAAFGWSSGEPEISDWESPAMLEFLRLVGQHPDQLAIALHEYSYVNEDIADAYPFKVGRFQQLFAVADRHGIPRPTVLITEWGWTYDSNPPLGTALEHIDWAARLYAPYPEIKGAAIWYLGPGFQGIADETQKLIAPLTVYNLTNYYVVPPESAPLEPEKYRP